ncbi:MAG: hypothetical protein V4636_11835 [Pseudomonadota bacterium]
MYTPTLVAVPSLINGTRQIALSRVTASSTAVSAGAGEERLSR